MSAPIPVEPPPPAARPRRRVRVGEVVAIVVIGLLVLIALPSGAGGVVMMLMLAAIVVAVWALIRGRSTTFRIRSRPVALGVLVTAVVVLMGGAGAYGAMHPASAIVAAAPSRPTLQPSHAAVAVAATPVAAPTVVASTAVAQNPGLAVLATLTVKGKAPLTGYDRTADFGPAWLDVDRNGCDTRNDILRRDLTATTGTGCRVLTGTLHDPYTGTVIHFVRGDSTSNAVQIDHVVSLADAWQTGAQALTLQQRADLGNDPINLFAVDGPTNEAKGDGDAATWLPANRAFRCTYVAHQVGVKAAYHLWVTQAEHDAMRRVLSACPTSAVPTSVTASLTPTVATPTPTASETTAPTRTRTTRTPTVYYADCAAVRAAGKAPLHRGDPGYRSGLDGDGDGVACESSGGGASSSGSSSGSDSGAPAGATAQCRDGSYSFSAHRSGTCSHHGGVATWL